MTATRTELGCVGHFIGARHCHWKRHTQVIGPGGRWRISSVGNYYPGMTGETMGNRTALGWPADSFFETMVFELGEAPAEDNEHCGCLSVKGWSEVDSRRYATAGEAQAGHEAFVKSYLKVARTNPRT